MEKMVEKTAKTVEEAVEEALKELNVPKELTEVEVLEEPTKGLLGIGAKPALVRVTLKQENSEEKIEKAKEVISKIISCMGMEIKINVEEKEDVIEVKIDGQDLGLIIGHKGETLDALQLITSVIVNKVGEYKRIEVDVQDYREKRKETLINLAEKKAKDVIKYNRNITLEPMNPYERRIIHTALQDNEKVTTISVGNEPYRKVVIKKA